MERKTAEIFQKLAEIIEGLTCQLDEALTTTRKVSRVVDKMAEQALKQVDEVKPVNTEGINGTIKNA